ncbi:MAG: molybdopterin cofactor-binding domain-containing protein, partial [Streptosporangiaceae bacterium]
MAVAQDAAEVLAAEFAAVFPHLDERQRLAMGARAVADKLANRVLSQTHTSRAAEPERPLDLSRADPDSFAAAMPDGLLTVVADDEDDPDDAWVHVGADGAITAFTGKVEAGQGTRTALSLLVAEELAVPADAIRLVMADTDSSPFDWGTFGSRSMPHA